MSVKGIRAVRSETGIASLMVTMILMIVISLIVLGFAQVSRREQRQSLDQQLNTQAFYAAETGVNDAKKVIAAQLALGQPVTDKLQCTNPASGPYRNLSTILDSANNIAYTCLLVSTQVPTLTNQLDPDTSWVVPLNAVDAADHPVIPNKLVFTWPAANGGAGISHCPTYKGGPNSSLPNLDNATYQSNCPYGVLRLDLVPIYPGGVTRAGLINDDLVVFFYPTTQSGSTNGTIEYTAGKSSTHQISANCTASTCSGTVDLSGAQAQAASMFYARVTMLYKGTGTNGNVSIGANSGVYFSGAQAQIDSTGKAQDVLRRIRESVSINQGNTSMPFAPAIASRDSICKRYTVGQGVAPAIQITASSDTNSQCNGSGATPAPTTDNGDIGTHCTGSECPNSGGGNKGGPAPDYVWGKTVWVTKYSSPPTRCVLYPDVNNTFPGGSSWTMVGNQNQCLGLSSFWVPYGTHYPQIEKNPITCHVFTAQAAFYFGSSNTPVFSKQTVTARIPQGAKKPAGC